MFSACGIAVTKLTTQTFGPGSHTWAAPTTTNRIDSMTGVGGPGQAAYEEYYEVYRRDVTTYNYYPATGETVATPNGYNFYGGIAPADYCTARITVSGGNQTWNCYHHEDVSSWVTVPATTGTSTTAFGKTFPGGTGGPGSNTTFTLVPINAGSSYNIFVPSGGSLTITYYK